MKAYWLPGISRYRRTKAEAQAEADASPYDEVELPTRHQETIDFLNAMLGNHEASLAASDAAYLQEEAKAKELGYPSLGAALEALRVLGEGGESGGEVPAPAPQVAVADPDPAPSTPRTGALIEDILALDENGILEALSASIGRLHEVAGFRGWQAFAKKSLSWGGGNLSTDRGLGMLLMAGLASLPSEPEDRG
ncbi:hypothetical protein [Sphingomonas sp. 3-13AW]|uniref:hypothetical protein n=1 Tax=Sphingomonas sp. 3-13AW TaxID=3050450 RepID=UPI003BB7EF6F